MQSAFGAFVEQFSSYSFVFGLVFAGFIIVGILLARVALRRFWVKPSPSQLLKRALEDDAWKKYLAAKTKFERALRSLSGSGRIVIPIINRFGPGQSNLTKYDPHSIVFDFTIVEQIRKAGKDDKIDLILHTPGGHALFSQMLARLIKGQCDEGVDINCYVPYVAWSAGTQIGLASNCIYMGKTAELGPIDTVFGGSSGKAWRDLYKEKTNETSDPFLLAYFDIDLEATELREQSEMLVNRNHKLSPTAQNVILDGTRSHLHSITFDKAETYKLCVEEMEPTNPLKLRRYNPFDQARMKSIYDLVDAKMAMQRYEGDLIDRKNVQDLIRDLDKAEPKPSEDKKDGDVKSTETLRPFVRR